MLENPAPSRLPPKMPPTPKGHPLWGSMRDLQANPLQTFMNATRQYGRVVRFRSGLGHFYLLSHPDDVKRVLQDNHPNYVRGALNSLYLKSLVGESLVTTDGPFWLRQRRLLQPPFHRQHLAQFGQVIVDETQALLERWRPWAAAGHDLDVAEQMLRLMMTIVGKTLFGSDVSDTAGEVGAAATAVQEHITYRMLHPLTLPEPFPTSRNRRFRTVRQTLDRVVFGVIQARRQSGEDGGDLLSMLLAARDEETGEAMTDEQVRNEVLSFFLAGGDTIATALAWTWYLLGQHPEAVQQLGQELEQVLGGRLPTAVDYPNLNYTAMVVQEAMRLYPPGWVIGRFSIEADEIGGYTIGAATLLNLCAYVTHRDPAFWPDPDVFDPQRFTPERAASRPRFAYYPFGGGPRQCIGNHFAMLAAVLIVATIAQRYCLVLAPSHPVEPHPRLTLGPRYGLRVHLEPA